jgi:hypothetical protein
MRFLLQMSDRDDSKEMRNTTRLFYQVERKSVCFIKFIIEAYDGIALMKTIDPLTAVIELNVAPGCDLVVKQLLGNLAHKYIIQSIQ